MNLRGNPGVGGRPFQAVVGGLVGVLGPNEVFGIGNRELRRAVGSGVLGRGGLELAVRVLGELRFRPPIWGSVSRMAVRSAVRRARVVW